MKNGTLNLERVSEFTALDATARLDVVLSAWSATEAELLRSGRRAFSHPADSIGTHAAPAVPPHVGAEAS